MDIMNVTEDVIEGDFLKNGDQSTYLTTDLNQTEGWILVGCTLVNISNPVPPTGDGTLAILNFTVVEKETSRNCPLNLSDTILLLEDLTEYADNDPIHGTFYLLMGDVNGDWIVNATDLSLLDDAYGSMPGDPNWNIECDLNNDGVVEAKDLTMLGKNYGKEW